MAEKENSPIEILGGAAVWVGILYIFWDTVAFWVYLAIAIVVGGFIIYGLFQLKESSDEKQREENLRRQEEEQKRYEEKKARDQAKMLERQQRELEAEEERRQKELEAELEKQQTKIDLETALEKISVHLKAVRTYVRKFHDDDVKPSILLDRIDDEITALNSIPDIEKLLKANPDFLRQLHRSFKNILNLGYSDDDVFETYQVLIQRVKDCPLEFSKPQTTEENLFEPVYNDETNIVAIRKHQNKQ